MRDAVSGTTEPCKQSARHVPSLTKDGQVLAGYIVTLPGPSQVVQWLVSICQYGGRELSPWSREIPHAAGQRALCTTTAEPTGPGAHASQQEKPAHHSKRRAPAARKTQSGQKENKYNKSLKT